MTQISRPFTGTTVGDSGPYSAQNWQDTWARLIGFNADNANYAPLKGVENELAVNATSPVSAQVQVETGSALAQGVWYYNNAAVTFPITANGSGNPRIDLVVLAIDYIAQEVRLDLLVGTPAASPAVPATTQTPGVLWEIPLAQVAVASGFASINQADITDRRSFSNIPNSAGLNVVNNSASILQKGNLVIRDTSAASTAYALDVTTTTTFADSRVIGIAESRIAAIGGTGRIIQYGIVPVICDGSVVLGDYLVSATTGGQATALTTGSQKVPFGVVVVANSGAGTACLAFVNCTPLRNEPKIAFSAYADADQAIAAATLTLLTWNQVDFNYGSDFDLATERFTPQIAGKYLIEASVTVPVTETLVHYIEIQKNGTNIKRHQIQGTTNFYESTGQVVALVDMNGTTDYIEVYGFSQDGTTLVKTNRQASFSGAWISD